jgi:hypothetical protein
MARAGGGLAAVVVVVAVRPDGAAVGVAGEMRPRAWVPRPPERAALGAAGAGRGAAGAEGAALGEMAQWLKDACNLGARLGPVRWSNFGSVALDRTTVGTPRVPPMVIVSSARACPMSARQCIAAAALLVLGCPWVSFVDADLAASVASGWRTCRVVALERAEDGRRPLERQAVVVHGAVVAQWERVGDDEAAAEGPRGEDEDGAEDDLLEKLIADRAERSRVAAYVPIARRRRAEERSVAEGGSAGELRAWRRERAPVDARSELESHVCVAAHGRSPPPGGSEAGGRVVEDADWVGGAVLAAEGARVQAWAVTRGMVSVFAAVAHDVTRDSGQDGGGEALDKALRKSEQVDWLAVSPLAVRLQPLVLLAVRALVPDEGHCDPTSAPDETRRLLRALFAASPPSAPAASTPASFLAQPHAAAARAHILARIAPPVPASATASAPPLVPTLPYLPSEAIAQPPPLPTRHALDALDPRTAAAVLLRRAVLSTPPT